MKMTFKKTFIFMTVLMLSAVSCSDTAKKSEISTDSSSVNSSNNSQGLPTTKDIRNIYEFLR